uniref:Uncharacterized protein n=1 Tax=Panagrolaimus sp. ES5 TaxID=591445 RepID=A0AC34FE24_9BILA
MILKIYSILFTESPTIIRRSCLEHFLNGESTTKILPISASDSSDSGPFYIECIFPAEKESDQIVQTKIHSALEKWHRIEPGKRETIGYQISDRTTLKKLVQSSEECSQEVFVQWPALTVIPEGQILGFTVEPIDGRQRVFQRNSTLESYTEALTLESVKDGSSHEAALLHILGTDEKQNFENVTAWIKLGPLICEQKIVENIECLWEINEKPDWIKVTGISHGFVKFAFRTDKPEGPFLRVTTQNGSYIQMDLLDGYLLSVGHVVHPVKFLADGNWHSAKFDVKALTVQIDDSLPIIYLSAINNEKAVSEVEILLNGQITAIPLTVQIDDSLPIIYLSAINNEKAVTEVEILLNGQITAIRGGVSDEWMCSDSTSLKSEVTPHILRRICPFYEANYCNCQAPASVLEKQSCGKVDEKKAFQLDRSPFKLGFFYSPNFGEKSKISIVFRSDSDIGLVFFGVANTLKSKTRVQTNFIGNKFFAASCTLSNLDGTEKCRSCSITRSSEDATKNEWIRLSYFHYKDYSYMTVNDAICQLTPIQTASAEVHVMDGANLYEVKTTNKSALFIGGTYYSNRMDYKSINKEFRKDFLDYTMEKSPSLRVKDATKNEWIRLSYFHYKDYSYMTVNDAICQLTPIQTASAEVHVMDGANLYEVKTTNKSALFIGGTYYSNRMDYKSINKEFRKDFLDYTMEKSPSLRGCVAEIIINEARENLEKLLKNQIKLITTNSNSEIFAIDKCQSCRVPIDQCAGAKCRSPSPLLGLPAVCDCTSIYALQEPSSGRCLANSSSSSLTSAFDGKKYGGLTLTSSFSPSSSATFLNNGKIILNRTTFVNSGKASLDRIWMLLRLPESSFVEKTIFKMASIQIKVCENGKKVIIEIDHSRHEFYIQNSKDDERLHLIAIKRNPFDSTFNIQVDNQIKASEFFEDSIKGKIDIFVLPVSIEAEEVDSEGGENSENAFPGCISELSIGYEYREPADNRAYLSKSNENRAHSVDLLNMIISDIQNSGNPIEKSFIQTNPCGIRDPSIWISNSSSYGTMKEYDPNGDAGNSASISIIITIFIVLLVLIALCLFCYCRQKKFKRYHLNTNQRYKPTVGKEEKVPLKDTYLDTSRSSTDHSHVG